jgi:hypothetical protein
MILNKVVGAGNFFYCMNYFPPYTQFTKLNSGAAIYHQSYYMLEGSAVVDARDSEDITDPIVHTLSSSKGQLVDAGVTKDKYITITVGDQSVAAVSFNPLSPDQGLAVEIIDTAQTLTVTAGDVRKTLVCLQGSMTANGIAITNGQHAKIFPGKSAEIVLNEGAICAIVQ